MTSDAQDESGEPSSTSAKDLHGRVMRGSAWIIAGRWAVRLIGIISTVILARLLVPEDFGLVAIALLVVGLAENIGKQGQRLAIIVKKDPDRDFINSAWTASILVGFALGLVVLASGSALASYFDEPRAQLVVYVMSIRVFLMGFENIGITFFVKNFDFATDFRLNIYEKVIPVSITITLAVIFRDYWAIVFGSVAGHISVIFITYIIHPYRPRICFKKIREVWAFSGWVLVETLGSFINMRADRFFIPGIGDTRDMGTYHVGAELARMPTFELFMPLRRVLFPAYAQLAHAPREMSNTFINVLSVAALICLPVSLGFAMVADEAVRIIYGQKWTAAAPIVAWLSVNAGATAIMSTVFPVIQAMNKPRIAASVTISQAVLLVGTLFLLTGQFTETAHIAAARTATSFAVIPLAIFCVRRVLFVPLSGMFLAVWRPLVASAAMCAMLYYILPADLDLPLGLTLAVRIGGGGATFAAVLCATWALSGYPPGAERALARLVGRKLGKGGAPAT